MRLGYFTLTDNTAAYEEKRRDPNQFLLEVMEEAQLADELGFNSVWVPEHHFGLFGCLPAPTAFLANLAARTQHVKLACATVLLPCNQPLRVAEEWSMLDVLSNGRVVFSAGRGYDKREYDAFNIPYEESRERFDEALLLIRKAMTEEEFTFNGKYYRVPEPLTIVPRPLQKPYPPFYIACFSEPTVRMAAEAGFNAIYAPFAAALVFGSLQNAAEQFKSMAAGAGNPDARVMCSYFCALADSKEEEQLHRERLLYYLQKCVTGAFPKDRAKTPPNYAYLIDITERLMSMHPQDLGERSIITGDPEACIEHLKRVEAAGIEEVILYFNFGAYSHVETMRMMERFAKQVMPHFQETGVKA
ncbi:MAG TPA: LLM class flavin-dependent oxidoreductase [Dehalococcoidia bacterium]|nr:LLM class flavin-dependent oxidoreductase [Dehalococcoidia bacterium]